MKARVFGTSGQKNAVLFAALATAAEQRMGNFNSQYLANSPWACAKVSQHNASLFAALAKAAEQRMGNFSSQDLADTARAFAKVIYSGRGNSVPRCCVGHDKFCHTQRRLRVNPKRPDGLLRINYHANQLHNDDSDDDSLELKNLKGRIPRGD